MDMITQRDLWLRVYKPVARPRLRIVCFPHAGGAASTFRTWPEHLPADVELHAVCYPGREGRLIEEPINQMGNLVEPLLAVIQPLLDRPVALFGHSMGASVAHEVALRLDDLPGARVAGLFVSGRLPPHRLPFFDTSGFGDDDTVIAEVLRLGQASAEAFEDLELRELLLPAIRADFDLVSTYRPGARPAIAVPVVAYGGDNDPDVAAADLDEWCTATTTTFHSRIFTGDHFYLKEHEVPLVRDIAARLAAARPVPVPSS